MLFQMNKSAGFSDVLMPELKILGRRVYRGPHYYSHTPMVQITLDLGKLEQWPTDKIPEFKDRLVALLPNLQTHGCSYGEPGGFIKRLAEGTWLGHVTEHIALQLQTEAGMHVTRGKTRSVKGKSGVYNVMFEYEAEKIGLAAGRYALEIVNSLLPPELAGIGHMDRLYVEGQPPFTTVNDAIQYLQDLAERERLGPTTRSITEAAARRHIPVMRLDRQSYVQLGWGKNQRRIRASVTDRTSMIATEAAGDKELTKQILKEMGIPVPKGSVVRSTEEAVRVATEIGYPVTLKPLNGNHGRGVTTNIISEDQVRQAFELALPHGKRVVVEQHYHGKDYRVLVINGRVTAVAERVPAHVVGDGVSTVTQLIDAVNADPKRSQGHANVLSQIIVNDATEHVLRQARLSLDSVPALNQKVRLCDTANLSTGGTAIDRTTDIHPANVAFMERAARTIGLDIAGIDVVTDDIAKPLGEHGGIVEVNAAPGFRMHLNPTEGQSRPVGDAVVSMLFSKDTPSRIPLVAITGTNGKSTTTRMVAHILRQTSACVGFTSTSGVYINDDLLWEGDASGPQSARKLLRDSCIEYAVLETARGGIVREGLAFDYCDVGIVMNVTADHIGLGDVQDVHDLANVKAVVVESVHSKGVSVLNADDPLTRDMAKVAGGRICYFSMNGGHIKDEFVAAHIESGGMAVVRENWLVRDEIVIYVDKERTVLMPTDKVASSHGGTVDFNIQNALAAIAAGVGLGVDSRHIRTALTSFECSFEENPGRLNIHDEHGFRVVLDYAHNPAALRALGKVVVGMRQEGKSLMGSISTPGDRRDEDIREVGRIAAEIFDFVVFREAPDRRGREAGGVLRLLAEGAREAGHSEEDMLCVEMEEEAADVLLSKATPGDVVVLTPTDVKGIWQRVLSFNGTPLSSQTDKTCVYHA